MCLYSKTLPKKSRKIRTCYKILLFFYSTSKRKYVLTSPYAFLNMQKYIKAGFFEDDKELRIDQDRFRDLYVLSKGLIHTYENYEDALNNSTRLSFYHRKCYIIIYKCQIPKGTKYCYGLKKYNVYPQYASKRIDFIESMDIIKSEAFNDKILKKGNSEYEEIINHIKKMK